MERYRVIMDGRERVVELGSPDAASTGASLTVTIDGQPRTVDVRRLGPGAFSILDGHAARLVQVSGVAPKLTVEVGHPDGEPRTLTVEIGELRPAGSNSTGGGAARGRGADGTIKSPIPGKVVKVLVSPGGEVKAGQPVVVIEAMKMENELRAPRDGSVANIVVREGQAVEAGETLVELR